MLYSHSADHIGTGNNYVILFAKYFGDGYSWIGWDISDTLNAGDAADVWHYRSVSCTVPDGATIVQVGALLYQPTNNDHGSAYIDRFEMYGDFLSYSIASSPSNGTLSGAPPFVTFSPNDNYNGTDSFTFTASDGLATSNTATVSVTVTAVNDAPVASDAAVTTNEDTDYSGTLSASDVDGDLFFSEYAAVSYTHLTLPTILLV